MVSQLYREHDRTSSTKHLKKVEKWLKTCLVPIDLQRMRKCGSEIGSLLYHTWIARASTFRHVSPERESRLDHSRGHALFSTRRRAVTATFGNKLLLSQLCEMWFASNANWDDDIALIERCIDTNKFNINTARSKTRKKLVKIFEKEHVCKNCDGI